MSKMSTFFLVRILQTIIFEQYANRHMKITNKDLIHYYCFVCEKYLIILYFES